MYLMDSLEKDNSDCVFDIAESFVTNVLGGDGQEIKRDVVEVSQQEEADYALFSCYNIQQVITCVHAAQLEDIVKGINRDWYPPESAAALRQELVKLIEQYHLRYKPVGTCQCGRHYTVVQKFGHTFHA
ncbi:uncharacterized protein [Triticum aestivum]|uniref:uncharacterized protein n=1 Tax=Triticum aestivum TaxID=4565 RepID=UPI001D022448|nr:uncharacterized protein LOC123106291 [Triticum aestivum]XP_044394120.1 uncharacterized protein LOC123117421 [Triticum aestivum]